MDQYIINVQDTLDVLTYLQGLLHSIEDRPAVSTQSGYYFWFYEGKLHRENGPAVTNPDGSVEYWFQGTRTK